MFEVGKSYKLKDVMITIREFLPIPGYVFVDLPKDIIGKNGITENAWGLMHYQPVKLNNLTHIPTTEDCL